MPSKAVGIFFVLALYCELTGRTDGWWLPKSLCKSTLAITCRVTAVGGGAAVGAGAGPIGAAAGAAAGQIASETCEPAANSICGGRRRTMADPYEFKEFDRRHRVVLFPQSFEDYQLTDGKIRLDHFLEGIEDVLPGHLHGLYQIGEAFMSADTNGDEYLDREEFYRGPWIVRAVYVTIQQCFEHRGYRAMQRIFRWIAKGNNSRQPTDGAAGYPICEWARQVIGIVPLAC